MTSPATKPVTVGRAAEPPREATLADRRAIADALDKSYHVSAERYMGDDSDQKVAERLNMPRAWVTSVRAMLYGQLDRNEAADAMMKRWNELADQAKTLETQAYDLTAKAEQLRKDIDIARGKVG
jgi:hypothetical protein